MDDNERALCTGSRPDAPPRSWLEFHRCPKCDETVTQRVHHNEKQPRQVACAACGIIFDWKTGEIKTVKKRELKYKVY